MNQPNAVRITLLAACVSLAYCSTGKADTYGFEGTVTSNNGSSSLLHEGDRVVGQFRYDPNATLLSGNQNGKEYSQAASSSNFQLGDLDSGYFATDVNSGTDVFDIYRLAPNDKSFQFEAQLTSGQTVDLLFTQLGQGDFVSYSIAELPPYFAANPSYNDLYLTEPGRGSVDIKISSLEPIPEPSSLVLLSLGGIGFWIVARRKMMWGSANSWDRGRLRPALLAYSPARLAAAGADRAGSG